MIMTEGLNNAIDELQQDFFNNLNIARHRFARLHIKNACLIGSKAFVNLMGETSKRNKQELKLLLYNTATTLSNGGEIVIDFNFDYSYREIEAMMSSNNLLIYEYVYCEDILNNYMPRLDDRLEALHRLYNPVFCLAVKKEHLK